MKVRTATDRDKTALADLLGLLQEHLVQANPALWRSDLTDCAARASAVVQLLDADDTRVFVAEDQSQLVGCAVARVAVRPAGRPRVVGHILWAFVREVWRRQGVGTALVAQMLAFFESKGVEDISLRYVVGNREAERFWRRLGFAPVIQTANQTPERLRRNLDQLAQK